MPRARASLTQKSTMPMYQGFRWPLYAPSMPAQPVSMRTQRTPAACSLFRTAMRSALLYMAQLQWN